MPTSSKKDYQIRPIVTVAYDFTFACWCGWQLKNVKMFHVQMKTVPGLPTVVWKFTLN